MTIDMKHPRRTSSMEDKEQEAAIALSSMIPPTSMKKEKVPKPFKGVKKAKSNKIEIPIHDIVRYMTIPQPLAAEELGVSISTLKRRYYELEFGRWPINSANGDNGEEYLHSKQLTNEEKGKIKSILNEEELPDSSIVDNLTMKILQCAFQQKIIEDA